MVLDVGNNPGYGMINYVQIELSGRQALRYTGESLLQYISTVNTLKEVVDHLASLAGGAGGDIGGETLLVPIIAPGMTGIMQSYGASGSNPAFPIGKLSTDMVVKIGLKTQAQIDVNTTIVLSSARLRYYRYKLKDDIGVAQTSQGKQVIYSYNFIYIQDAYWDRAVTAASVYTQDISNVVTSADLQWVSFYTVIDGNRVTAAEMFTSEEIVNANLKIKGSVIVYEHTTTKEARMRNLVNFKNNNVFPNTGTYFYNVPISANFAWRTDTIGAAGCNLDQETPILAWTAPATDTVRLHVMAVFKASYDVLSDKTAKETLQKS